MVSTEMREEILRALDRLPPDAQARVLDFARTAGPPGGFTAEDVLAWSNAYPALSEDEASDWMKAIEEECEQVDADAW